MAKFERAVTHTTLEEEIIFRCYCRLTAAADLLWQAHKAAHRDEHAHIKEAIEAADAPLARAVDSILSHYALRWQQRDLIESMEVEE